MAKNHQVVFGIHAVNELIKRTPERFIELFLLKGRVDERLMPIIHLARKHGIAGQQVSRKVLDEKTKGEQHQGVGPRVRRMHQKHERAQQRDRLHRAAPRRRAAGADDWRAVRAQGLELCHGADLLPAND